jgi:hypothetical protein
LTAGDRQRSGKEQSRVEYDRSAGFACGRGTFAPQVKQDVENKKDRPKAVSVRCLKNKKGRRLALRPPG